MAKVRNLRVLPGGWEFRISAGSADFAHTIDHIKAKVPKDMRGFSASDGTWFISNRYPDVMAKLFENFKSELDAIECQGVLFG